MTYSLRRIALHKIIDTASVLDRLTLSKSTVIEDVRYELINKCKFSDLWPHEQIPADQLRMDAYYENIQKEGTWLTTQPSAPPIPWQLSIVRTAPRHFEAGMSVNFKVTPALRGRPEVAIGFRQARSCR
jgi:hypothetical protein